MNRRSFLAAMLAAAAAPAFVRAGSLMVPSAYVNGASKIAVAPLHFPGGVVRMTIYSGPVPSSMEAVDAGHVIASHDLKRIPAAARGTIEFEPFQERIVRSALATFYRLEDKDGKALVHGPVGRSGFGEFRIDNPSLSAGSDLSITNIRLRAGTDDDIND